MSSSDSSEHLVFGVHAVKAAIRHDPDLVRQVWVQAGQKNRRVLDLVNLAKKVGVRVESATRSELDDRAGNGKHQGIAAATRQTPGMNEKAFFELLDGLAEVPFLLVLDGVQDPHNLGACLRTADAAGIHAVIAPRDKAVGITPVVAKVASGAAETVAFVQVANLARCLDAIAERGIFVLGLAGEGATTIYEADMKGPLALVMGAEGSGIRRLTAQHCDQLLSIPMNGSVESLNVSVATGVTVYEALRQRSA